MKKTVKIILCIFAILILLCIGGIFFLKIQLLPKKYENNTQFTIDQGMYGKQVFDKLEDEGIIRNSKLDYIYIHYLSGVPIDFKAGTFELPTGLTLEEIVTILSDDSKFYRPTSFITIPEGTFLTDIAEIVSMSLDVSKEDLIIYWNDEDVVRGYMNDYPFITEEMFNSDIKYILEGYLFPSTYEFYQNSTADEITRRLLDQTLSIYTKYKDDFDSAPVFYHHDNGEDSKATIHEIFTMASMLEWESGNDEDMQDISSVFYNRLNRDTADDLLRSSVTACYSQDLDKNSCILIDQSTERALQEDGETYNTYAKYGLPIGPISNPGEAAIYAALHPNETDYYFFIGALCGDRMGETVFTKTYDEHLAMSKKYIGACSIN